MAVSVSAVLANSFGGRLFEQRQAQSQPPATAATPEARDTAPAATADYVLEVPTIHCQGCVATLQAYLLAVDGIDEVEGDPKTKTIRVSYRPDMVVPEAIEKAIYRLGHKTKAA